MLVGLVSAYLGVAGLAFAGQRRIMYPRPATVLAPRVEGARLERVIGADGEVVTYALYAPARSGQPTIAHFHGNGEDLAYQGLVIETLRAHGLGVFAVEYPGYGLLRDRRATEAAIYSASLSALRHLREELGVPSSSTVLQGQSLGTGVATELALGGYASRLILISPFTSMTDMARRLLPFLPVSLLVRDRYDTASKAARITLPTLVIHGSADSVIPVQMGERVAALLRDGKFVRVDGAGHNDLFASYQARVVGEIVAFASPAS